MYNISKLIAENKLEAIGIIKSNGGSMSFIGGKDPEGNEWLDGVDKKALPWVIIADCELIDAIVLAVRLNESGEIEFYGFDTKVPEASDWREVSECANGTENEIYEFIGDYFFLDKNGKAIKVGEKVIWYDPEESARDLSRVWEVSAINGEVVSIADDFSEAEVDPSEIEIV